jgi:phthiocerol/phenolphthiocerol synthesis type-I polyketide synthase D
VVVNGRSTPSPTTLNILNTVRENGTEVIVVLGDIADPVTAARVIDTAVADERDLRGVLHAAAVVDDATISNLDQDLLARVWRGKAEGAWALHQATQHHELDFFACFSSMASLVGSPGQAAYAAANAFVDDLIQWRSAHGLPATGIHWGAWAEVGRGRHMAERGLLTIAPADGIDALERILDAGYHTIAYFPIELDRWIADFPHLQDLPLLSALLPHRADQGEGKAVLREELLAIDGDAARRHLLETFLIEQVRDLLGGTTRHIGPHTSLVMLGLDSLAALRLQQRIGTTLKVDIKPGVIWVKPHVADLATLLLDTLGMAEPGTTSADPGRPTDDDQEVRV